ncbi:hypothetical protein HYFRA_00002839 [Hymenoscyphus fraxineus]|uniref:Uncharacterized protein n=1 Tax=Hymenoscyphus fraxineus TaxID=746836 RepID=A0A9N9PP32_9HELO|nr:hypothetical protein HYFRA_00002839 [Hymenoscyphus fraxineus]
MPDHEMPRGTQDITTEANGNGMIHHVTGDITHFRNALRYMQREEHDPKSQKPSSTRKHLGTIQASDYPHGQKMNELLKAQPPPPKQKELQHQDDEDGAVETWWRFSTPRASLARP